MQGTQGCKSEGCKHTDNKARSFLSSTLNCYSAIINNNVSKIELRNTTQILLYGRLMIFIQPNCNNMVSLKHLLHLFLFKDCMQENDNHIQSLHHCHIDQRCNNGNLENYTCHYQASYINMSLQYHQISSASIPSFIFSIKAEKCGELTTHVVYRRKLQT